MRELQTEVTHALTGEGHDASEDGTGRGTPLVPVAYRVHGEHSTAMTGDGNADVAAEVDVARCLDSCGGYATNQGGNVVAFAQNQRDELRMMDIAGALSAEPGMKQQTYINQAFQTRIARNGRGQPKEITDALTSCEGGTHADTKPHVTTRIGIRRLTPRECERLQGFPDDWTRFDAAGKELSDSARYRMLGNAVSVPVAEWIGRRIIEAGDCGGLRSDADAARSRRTEGF